jgi:hypothetical protein
VFRKVGKFPAVIIVGRRGEGNTTVNPRGRTPFISEVLTRKLKIYVHVAEHPIRLYLQYI